MLSIFIRHRLPPRVGHKRLAIQGWVAAAGTQHQAAGAVVSPETKRRLEALAQATERTQSWLAEAALQNYLDSEGWQVRRIQEGVAAADRGEVIENERVLEWAESWGTDHEKLMPEPR